MFIVVDLLCFFYFYIILFIFYNMNRYNEEIEILSIINVKVFGKCVCVF